MHSWNGKRNLKGAVLNAAMLANQLIQTIFCHCAVTVRICIHAVVRAGSHAIYRDTKTDRLAILRRPQDEMQIASMKAIANTAGCGKQGCDLTFIFPFANKGPLVEFERSRSSILEMAVEVL